MKKLEIKDTALNNNDVEYFISLFDECIFNGCVIYGSIDMRKFENMNKNVIFNRCMFMLHKQISLEEKVICPICKESKNKSSMINIKSRFDRKSITLICSKCNDIIRDIIYDN